MLKTFEFFTGNSGNIDTIKVNYRKNFIVMIFALILIFYQRIWFFDKIPFIYIFYVFYIFLLYMINKIKLNRNNFFIFLIFVVSAIISFVCNIIFNISYISFYSLGYLICIYFIFTSVLNFEVNGRACFLIWNRLVLIAAIFAIIQMVVQIFAHYYIDLSFFLPHSILNTTGYNTYPLIRAGSYFRKANGLFFLEPASLSQFMALSMVLEILYLRNIVRFIFYFAALIVSFSGTGILMLSFFIVMYLFSHIKSIRFTTIILSIVFIMFGSLIIVHTSYGVYLLHRISTLLTLKQQDTSAYIRFFAPVVVIFKVTQHSFSSFLFGLGPGLHNIDQLDMLIKPNLFAIAQIFVYYGFFTTLLYVFYMFFVTFTGNLNINNVILLSVVLFMYLFCNGALLIPNVSFILLWFIWVIRSSSILATSNN